MYGAITNATRGAGDLDACGCGANHPLTKSPQHYGPPRPLLHLAVESFEKHSAAMKLYHRTYSAEAILWDGFHDGEGNYPTLEVHRGVWVYDEPLDERDGALGNVVLVISGVPEAAVAAFEWLHPLRLLTFREFLVPADLLNRFPIVGIYPDNWLWLGGNFEYVGSLIDMRPILTKPPEDDEHAGDSLEGSERANG